MATLRIENLTFRYPKSDKNALENINLDVRDGEFMLICGNSGCGKSTLLRHFKSVLTPYGERTGQVFINDKPLGEYSDREQASNIGFVMQHPDDQIVTDKVWHELAFGLESLGYDQTTMRLRVGEMASYFGIQNWFYKSVTELSGGQKQLLNLASIMAMNPQILILDEPTSQLDPIAASEFLNTVKKINTELGVTVIMTEHRLEEAFCIADRTVVMKNGKIELFDTPQEVSKKINIEEDVFKSLPASARMFRLIETNKSCDCPLTVRDGRNFINSLNLKGEKLESKENNAVNTEPVLELDECFFRYEKQGNDILKGVSLKAYKGEIFCLVGGNGTGKSTTLSIISGLNTPYRGKIKINGKVQKRFQARDYKIGALCQDPRTLFVKNTVLEDLKEITNDEKKLKDIIELMNIRELLGSHPFDLSGGEQQRTAIAKLLLTEPEILLLDEPTKGMDASFKEKFGSMLKNMTSKGISIIMVSHDVEFAAKYADRCGLFFDGTIISENEPRTFFAKNHFYTTAANRIARSVFENAVLTEEVVALCRKQRQGL